MDNVNAHPAQTPQFLFQFEADLNEVEIYRWISDNWAIGFYCVTVYAVFIFGGTKYMKNRPRYELRTPLIIWNALLTILSLMGVIRIGPNFIQDIYGKGWHYSMCDASCFFHKPASFWAYLFVLSKIWELGDTIFIVLRKQKLIFLHYYHHITVLLYCWLFSPQELSTHRWFILINYFVHSFMYFYYMLRALKIRVPKFVNMALTSMQILQMIVGMFVNIYNGRMLSLGQPCAANWQNLYCALFMCISYFFLFAKFFYDVYVRPKPALKLNGITDKNDSVQSTSQNGYQLNGTKKSN